MVGPDSKRPDLDMGVYALEASRSLQQRRCRAESTLRGVCSKSSFRCSSIRVRLDLWLRLLTAAARRSNERYFWCSFDTGMDWRTGGGRFSQAARKGIGA